MGPETGQSTTDKVVDHLSGRDDILIGILYGSIARGQERPESDVDIALAGTDKLPVEQKMNLIEDLAETTGRPVDLIDLQQAGGTILHQILTRGKLVYCTDHQLYARLIKRMLFDQADLMPYRDRILEERRKAWIDE